MNAIFTYIDSNPHVTTCIQTEDKKMFKTDF